MRVRVNGRERELPQSINLREYVVSLGVNMSTIAVAVNGEVVKRDSLASVELAEGTRSRSSGPSGAGDYGISSLVERSPGGPSMSTALSGNSRPTPMPTMAPASNAAPVTHCSTFAYTSSTGIAVR